MYTYFSSSYQKRFFRKKLNINSPSLILIGVEGKLEEKIKTARFWGGVKLLENIQVSLHAKPLLRRVLIIIKAKV